MSRVLTTVLLLICSNIFMTAAWYGHLKFHDAAKTLTLAPLKLLPVILISWLIAFPEYLLQVPANRIGHTNFGGPFTAPQLKILQEAITLIIFSAFSVLFLKESLRPRDLLAFTLILLAVVIAMSGRGAPLTTSP